MAGIGYLPLIALGFMDLKNVNLEADSYIIQQDCFVVERRDKNTLYIKVDANPLSVQRIITVGSKQVIILTE